MTKIHNNPKLSGDARMPVIFTEELENEWLKPLSKTELQKLIQPFPDSELVAHSVRRLSGIDSPSNIFDANKEHKFKELEFDNDKQLSMFA